MEIIKAIILGIIQGLTEFLPVSSSGHIELGKEVLNFDLGDENLLFSIIVHCATVLSTIVIFRKDILQLIKSLFKFEWNEDTQFVAKILVSMIPVVVIGLTLKDRIEAAYDGKIAFVGAMLLITGLLLLLTRYASSLKTEGRKVSFKDAIIIGVAQALAVLPGISRSGSTISTGLLLGVDKNRIARFSFLMVLIPILGITLLDVKDFLEEPTSTQTNYVPFIAGFVAAFFSGLLACTWMINIVKKGKLNYFAYYCFIVGIIAIAYGLWN